MKKGFLNKENVFSKHCYSFNCPVTTINVYYLQVERICHPLLALYELYIPFFWKNVGEKQERGRGQYFSLLVEIDDVCLISSTGD